MTEFLKALYDNFYSPLRDVEREDEIHACHQRLIEVLEKPERKLVLQIIDDKDYIAGKVAFDSFISGFCMAWKLSREMANYEQDNEGKNQF